MIKGKLRSTKAGAETPATPQIRVSVRLTQQSLNEGRSRNSGNTSRRAFHVDLGGLRSTKAGAETPATHGLISLVAGEMIALNEGRSRNSGNTQG